MVKDDSPRILIVDDEPRMAESTAAVLNIGGYKNVTITDDAPAAVAHINSGMYDLVLLDVMMPGMSGFQLLDALDRADLNTIFIIVTGDTAVDTAVEALRAGADDYVRKPCDPDELLVRIRNSLERRNIKFAHHRIETENRSLERQLHQAQKMEAIGALAGGVAHDFNNILAIILGNTELARSLIAPDAPASENLNKVRIASMRAKDLINQLLSFSRRTDSSWEALELNSLITECLALMRASIPSNIMIRHNLTESSFYIKGDATQIHQIVINLCTNSAHAMSGGGGILEVRVDSVADYTSSDPGFEAGAFLRLCVSDTGTGIDQDTIGRIFDPYFTTKEIGRGTGMGLAVVHGIVKNHGGEIRVTSEPNVKTEFQVFLPLSEGEVTTLEKQPGERMQRGNERIMLVDDEEMVADVMDKLLSQLGYQVSAFTSSVAALNAFRDAPGDFDLLISDMTMPELTGEMLAERFVAIRANIPVILCSGYNEAIDQLKTQQIGIRDFIMKPAKLKDIARSVRAVLDEPAIDRRRDKRFVPSTGAFVIFESNPNEHGRLLDVSFSGLSVGYEAGETAPEIAAQLSIVAEDGFRVDQLAYTSVFDVEVDTNRRCGIHFENLSPSQQQQLEQFIQVHANEQVM